MPFGLEPLVEPTPSLADEGERREARVLAATTLVLLLVGGLYLGGEAAVVAAGADPLHNWALGIGVVAFLAVAAAYVLARYGHARTGALTVVAVLLVGSWTFAVTAREAGIESSGVAVLLNAVVAVAFLRVREVAVVHGLNLLFLSLHQAVVPAPPVEWAMSVLVYVVALSALTARRFLTDADLSELDRYATEWRAVMETSDAAIVSLDTEYRMRSFNHAAQELARQCGFRPLQVGHSVFQLAPPEVHAIVVALAAPALRGEMVQEVRPVPTPGGEMEVDVTVKPMRSRHGGIVGASALIRDVTEERLHREQAEERIAQTRSAVLNAASHELNTPLTPLVIQLTLLRQGHLGPVTENQRAALDTMDRSVRHLRRNVEAFLHATRLEQALAHAGSEVVDLSDLVRDWATSRGGERIVGSLACDRGVRVVGDPRLLFVALRALADTLLRWSREERVAVSVTARGGEALLTVADPESRVGQEDLEAMEAMLGEAAKLVGYAGLLSLHVGRRVVAHHGGTLRLHHDEGLRLEAVFPMAPRFLETSRREAPRPVETGPDPEELLPPRQRES